MKKIYIWGNQIPGNHSGSKNDILEIHEEYTMQDLFEKYPGIWDKTRPEIGDMSGNDTMVYRQEIEHGPALMTYEDQPFLVPYLVEESDRAVIICPGGAYLTKSMIEEGRDVALALNQAGINAFVLWYRSYPYRAPYMYMDCQRAIRYLRFHADKYGINPEKIALAGFSAGGNLAAVTSLNRRDKNDFDQNYTVDAIDQTSAHINALALVYPAIVIDEDKIIAAIGGKELYDDATRRKEFADKYAVLGKLSPNDAPLFLCAANDDDVVPAKHLLSLAIEAEEKSVSCALHLFPYGGHGFGACQGEQMPQFAKDRSLVENWLSLFTAWVNGVLQ